MPSWLSNWMLYWRVEFLHNHMRGQFYTWNQSYTKSVSSMRSKRTYNRDAQTRRIRGHRPWHLFAQALLLYTACSSVPGRWTSTPCGVRVWKQQGSFVIQVVARKSDIFVLWIVDSPRDKYIKYVGFSFLERLLWSLYTLLLTFWLLILYHQNIF